MFYVYFMCANIKFVQADVGLPNDEVYYFSIIITHDDIPRTCFLLHCMVLSLLSPVRSSKSEMEASWIEEVDSSLARPVFINFAIPPAWRATCRQ